MFILYEAHSACYWEYDPSWRVAILRDPTGFLPPIARTDHQLLEQYGACQAECIYCAARFPLEQVLVGDSCPVCRDTAPGWEFVIGTNEPHSHG